MPTVPADDARCELCGRLVPRRLITLHHLIPKQKGGTHRDRIPTCKPCHKMVHATFANVDLAKRFTTLDQLQAAAELQPFLHWIRKQKPDRNFSVALSGVHPGSKRKRLALRRRWR